MFPSQFGLVIKVKALCHCFLTILSLNPFPNNKILGWSNMKAAADHKICHYLGIKLENISENIEAN